MDKKWVPDYPSRTVVDMEKVKQMLDDGWEVRLHKNMLGTYAAIAGHTDDDMKDKLPPNYVDDDDEVTTDDMTPEQALTRLAYKVDGKIIDGVGLAERIFLERPMCECADCKCEQ
jgi:hypothetical protein